MTIIPLSFRCLALVAVDTLIGVSNAAAGERQQNALRRCRVSA